MAVQAVSRWERKEKPLAMKPAVDRLVRLMVLAGDAVKGYPLEEMATDDPQPTRFGCGLTEVVGPRAERQRWRPQAWMS